MARTEYGNVDLDNRVISNVPDPTADDHVANKSYVDAGGADQFANQQELENFITDKENFRDDIGVIGDEFDASISDRTVSGDVAISEVFALTADADFNTFNIDSTSVVSSNADFTIAVSSNSRSIVVTAPASITTGGVSATTTITYDVAWAITGTTFNTTTEIFTFTVEPPVYIDITDTEPTTGKTNEAGDRYAPVVGLGDSLFLDLTSTDQFALLSIPDSVFDPNSVTFYTTSGPIIPEVFTTDNSAGYTSYCFSGVQRSAIQIGPSVDFIQITGTTQSTGVTQAVLNTALLTKADTDLQNISTTLTGPEQTIVRDRIGVPNVSITNDVVSVTNSGTVGTASIASGALSINFPLPGANVSDTHINVNNVTGLDNIEFESNRFSVAVDATDSTQINVDLNSTNIVDASVPSKGLLSLTRADGSVVPFMDTSLIGGVASLTGSQVPSADAPITGVGLVILSGNSILLETTTGALTNATAVEIFQAFGDTRTTITGTPTSPATFTTTEEHTVAFGVQDITVPSGNSIRYNGTSVSVQATVNASLLVQTPNGIHITTGDAPLTGHLRIEGAGGNVVTEDSATGVITVTSSGSTIPEFDALAAYPTVDTAVRAGSGNLFVNRVAIPAVLAVTTVDNLESAFYAVGGSGDFLTFIFPSTFIPVDANTYTLSYSLGVVRRVQFDGSDISLLTGQTNIFIVSISDVRLATGTLATGFTTGQPVTIDNPQLSHSATADLPNLDPELDNGVSGRWEQVSRIDALDPSRYLLSANSRLEWTENNISVRGVVSEIEEVSFNTTGEPVTSTVQANGDVIIAGLTSARATAMINAGRVASHLEDTASLIVWRVAAIAGSTTSVTWLPVASNSDIGTLNEAETRASIINIGDISSRFQVSLIVESEVAPGTISIESSIQPTGYLVNTAARRLDIGFDPATFINAGDNLTYTVTIANTPDNIATFLGSDVTEDTTSGVNVSEWRVNEADIVFSQGTFATLPSGFQTGGITLSERVDTLSVGGGLNLTVDGLQATFDVNDNNIINASVSTDNERLTLNKRQGDPVTFAPRITTLDTLYNTGIIAWRKDSTAFVLDFANDTTPVATNGATYRISVTGGPAPTETFSVDARGGTIVRDTDTHTWTINADDLENTDVYDTVVVGATGTGGEIDIEKDIDRLRLGSHLTGTGVSRGLVEIDVDVPSVQQQIVLPAPGFTLRDEFEFSFLVPNNLNPIGSARENGIWEMRFAAEGTLTATEVRDRALQLFGIQDGGSSRATSHLTHDIVLTDTTSMATGTLLGGRVQISARGTNEISLAWENRTDSNAFLDGLGITRNVSITVESPITDTIVSVNGQGNDIEVTSDGSGVATINYTGTAGGGGGETIILNETTPMDVDQGQVVINNEPGSSEIPVTPQPTEASVESTELVIEFGVSNVPSVSTRAGDNYRLISEPTIPAPITIGRITSFSRQEANTVIDVLFGTDTSVAAPTIDANLVYRFSGATSGDPAETADFTVSGSDIRTRADINRPNQWQFDISDTSGRLEGGNTTSFTEDVQLSSYSGAVPITTVSDFALTHGSTVIRVLFTQEPPAIVSDQVYRFRGSNMLGDNADFTVSGSDISRIDGQFQWVFSPNDITGAPLIPQNVSNTAQYDLSLNVERITAGTINLTFPASADVVAQRFGVSPGDDLPFDGGLIINQGTSIVIELSEALQPVLNQDYRVTIDGISEGSVQRSTYVFEGDDVTVSGLGASTEWTILIGDLVREEDADGIQPGIYEQGITGIDPRVRVVALVTEVNTWAIPLTSVTGDTTLLGSSGTLTLTLFEHETVAYIRVSTGTDENVLSTVTSNSQLATAVAAEPTAHRIDLTEYHRVSVVDVEPDDDLEVVAPLELNGNVLSLDVNALNIPTGTVTYYGNVTDYATFQRQTMNSFGDDGDEFYVPTTLTGVGINPIVNGLNQNPAVLANGASAHAFTTFWYIPNVNRMLLNFGNTAINLRLPGVTGTLPIGRVLYTPNGDPITVDSLSPGYFTGSEDVRFTFTSTSPTNVVGAPLNQGDANPLGLELGDMIFADISASAEVGLYKKVNGVWTFTNTTFTAL